MLISDILRGRYFVLADTLLMADDIPNATAALAVAMKGHEVATNVHVEEAEEAAQLEQEGQNGETNQVPDGSMLAGEAAEDIVEGDGEPRDAEGGTCPTHPFFIALSLINFGHRLYAASSLHFRMHHYL
jgi:hypothetical protein